MQRYRILASSMFLILVGFSTGHSAEPVKGTGDWTLYYIAEASSDVVKSGGNVAVITRDGEKLRYQVAPAELRKATVEGTAAGVDPKTGAWIVSNIVATGVWEDLPEGWEGKGNRANPLATYRSVAADQKHHPFGSRIYAETLKGWTPPGFEEPHDGFLWVSDVGGAIKGWMRFDLFVGKQSTYDFVRAEDKGEGQWHVPIEIEHMPHVPKGYELRTYAGVHKILHGVGIIENEEMVIDEVEDSIAKFQKLHKHIPKSEYDDTRGAITQWYLTQAALKVSKGEVYDPVAAGLREAADPEEDEGEEKQPEEDEGEEKQPEEDEK